MKLIKKIAISILDAVTGAIFNSTNISDKEHNTYSAEIIDELVKEVYSTDEIVIGTYMGKTLYRKAFRFTDLLIASKEVVTLIEMGNTVQMVDLKGNVTYMGNTYPLGDWTNANMLGWAWSEVGALLIYNPYTDQRAFADIKVTLEYTKTTD